MSMGPPPPSRPAPEDPARTHLETRAVRTRRIGTTTELISYSKDGIVFRPFSGICYTMVPGQGLMNSKFISKLDALELETPDWRETGYYPLALSDKWMSAAKGLCLILGAEINRQVVAHPLVPRTPGLETSLHAAKRIAALGLGSAGDYVTQSRLVMATISHLAECHHYGALFPSMVDNAIRKYAEENPDRLAEARDQLQSLFEAIAIFLLLQYQESGPVMKHHPPMYDTDQSGWFPTWEGVVAVFMGDLPQSVVSDYSEKLLDGGIHQLWTEWADFFRTGAYVDEKLNNINNTFEDPTYGESHMAFPYIRHLHLLGMIRKKEEVSQIGMRKGLPFQIG